MLARVAAWRLVQAARASTALARQQPRSEGGGRRLSTTAPAAAAAPARQGPGGRPSKTAAKENAKQFQDVARQLSRLTDKQLARLTPLLGDAVVDAAAMAARISHRNQGRQRQEGLVAKLLREAAEIGEASLDQLQAAIEAARTGQGVIANPAVQRQVEAWMGALLGGDSEAATLVFGLAQASGAAEPQGLRQLLRQAQQTEAAKPAAAAEAAAAEASASEGSTSSGEDGLAAAAADGATAAAQAGDSSSGGTAPRLTSKALAARRQLRKLLQPLAEAHVAAAEEEAEEQ